MRKRGYEIIIITNQYLINERFINRSQCEELTTKMIDMLRVHDINVLDIFYCPHARGEGCDCMKPNDGMIKQAVKKYPDIDLEQSFVMGDSNVDLELALNMDMKGFGIGVGSTMDHHHIYKINR
ncbi:HAD-IIIA family hydrolase [Evansella halocellulosilytica]|uniref:HAD-IIIA family hydrolase n=1 Tax=Evansella halocellulosilytica TaxID=2011013 RepID=UPI000BB9A351|nr:HAD-IIIA family hydrolase [Evansella halocellulosilytica]